jgi:8-oxo-dGTP diphosphatase
MRWPAGRWHAAAWILSASMCVVAASDDGVIRVSAVVLRDASGALLTVRKRGTSHFMLPGGKLESGESAAEAAVRECAEELSVRLDPESLRELGVFRAAAANENGHEVVATVFEHPPVVIDGAAAEIEELRWLDPNIRPLPPDLAPLLAERVVPVLPQPAISERLDG